MDEKEGESVAWGKGAGHGEPPWRPGGCDREGAGEDNLADGDVVHRVVAALSIALHEPLEITVVDATQPLVPPGRVDPV